jgi:NTE family protein|tara:strand:+ start:326 stop:1213 length:888 start_codon:yes stop_codon:yes gene_type:complete
MTDLTHLFISGSHLWGLYNLGIIRYIQAYPHYFTKIKDIGGVSFGAITAYLIILNIDISRIEKLFYKLVENEEFKLINYDKLLNIIYEKGIQDVSIYFDIFEKELNEFKGLTFADISKKYGKNLHILALCVSTGELTLFNIDNTPNIVVTEAIKASSSVPIISTPVEIDGYLYCDPCITNNTILEYFPDIPKNQILSIIHKFNTTVKVYEKSYKLTNMEYYMNLISIYKRKQNYISTARNINDNTLVINNHDSLISMTTNEEGFYLNIDTKTVDYALLHGFKLMVDWIEKHYKDK